MKRIFRALPIILIVFILLIGGGCKKESEVTMDCISGVIVGQKCNAYAFKLDKKEALGATDWQKKVDSGDGKAEYIDYKNVIGLLNLPEAYRLEGRRLFVKVRKPTEEESIVPCYLDMPNPPKPVYVVIAIDTAKCPE